MKLLSTAGFKSYFTLAILLLAVSLNGNAQRKRGKNKAKEASCCASTESTAKASGEKTTSADDAFHIPDAQLVNQDGEKVSLKELTKDKVVAMNFVFTTCTTICPVMGVKFSDLVSKMQPHIG
jgi:protein SCO1/2